MEITWLGHASFKIVAYDKVIYIDPYIGDYDDKADIILITHDHYDHFSESITRSILKDSTYIFGPKSIGSRFHGASVLAPGDEADVEKIMIKALPAYNINKPFHQGDEQLGFLINAENHSLYLAGDTDFIPEMKNVSAEVVLLPVSGTYVMDAREAAKAIEAIKPKYAIPMHYGSMVGTPDDAELFKELVEDNTETAVKILGPGVSMSI